jgi:hypothetical protein
VGMETLEGKGYSSSLFIPRYLSYIKAERKRCKIKNIFNHIYLAGQHQFGYTFLVIGTFFMGDRFDMNDWYMIIMFGYAFSSLTTYSSFPYIFEIVSVLSFTVKSKVL